ncbi:MAG: spore cortex biosynthesis protein YabQ [Bacilli bacterium]
MTLSVQFYTLLSMIGMGACVGMTLDGYQRLLQRKMRNKWVVFATDIAFWFLQCVTIFYFLLQTNHGDLHLYIFLALFLGFATYKALLATYFMIIFEHGIVVVGKLMRILRVLCNVCIVQPVLWIWRLLKSILSLLLGIVGTLVISIKNVLFFILRLVLMSLTFWIPQRFKEKVTNNVQKVHQKYQIFKKKLIELFIKEKKDI